MARGMPVVTTRVGREGIDARPGEDRLGEDSPEGFAAQVGNVLRDPALQDRLAKGGRGLAEVRYDRRVVLKELDRASRAPNAPDPLRGVLGRQRRRDDRVAIRATVPVGDDTRPRRAAPAGVHSDHPGRLRHFGPPFPDDGHTYPALCPHDTAEAGGRHLGNVPARKVRGAEAVWVLMARLTAWESQVDHKVTAAQVCGESERPLAIEATPVRRSLSRSSSPAGTSEMLCETAYSLSRARAIGWRRLESKWSWWTMPPRMAARPWWPPSFPRVVLIRNAGNAGFAPATNQGISAAGGPCFCC